LVKYGKRKHNILRGCTTIRLGTLKSYSADDPDFLRHDAQEGNYSVSKKHGVRLEGQKAADFTGLGWKNMEIAEGARAVRRERFPSCYIFCLSQTTPSLTVARRIDPCYDDWFEITDGARFTCRLNQLLKEQIRPTELELTTSSSFAGWGIHTIGNSVAYGERHVVLDHENFDEAMRPIREPLKRIFLKPSDHQSIKEYRIAFVVTDNDRKAISVKEQAKYIHLMPSDPILSTAVAA